MIRPDRALRRRWIELPPGTYAAARAAVATQMPAVVGTFVEPDFDCPTDLSPAWVSVAPPVQGVTKVARQCGDNTYAPLGGALADLIPLEAR